MRGKRIALLESRLGVQLAQLIEREGAIPLHAPALAEVPDADPQALGRFLDSCAEHPPELFIFQTGVGTQALLDLTEQLGRTAELLSLLAHAKIAERGPKPAAVLRAHAIRIDIATIDPHTTTEVLKALDSVPLAGWRVAVQRYGETNPVLLAALRDRGADAIELPTYRWALPADTAPLAALIDALERDTVDAAVFTSASQPRNLFAFAKQQGREQTVRNALQHVTVISIGPVCTRALEALGVQVHAEASPPKLGPLMKLLRERL
jgi:uroporphyrinogen-III synthase